MSKHCYGIEGEEIYTAKDIDAAFEELCDTHDGDLIGIEIIELAPSKKSGVRFCQLYQDFFECATPCSDCAEYNPANGKNGVCVNLKWGLIETGAKWEIVGDYKYKKLSGRDKR